MQCTMHSLYILCRCYMRLKPAMSMSSECISNICTNSKQVTSRFFPCHTGCLLVVQPCQVCWQLMLLLGGVSETAACCRLLRELIAVSVCCAWRCCKCSFPCTLNGCLTTLYIPSICIYIHTCIYAAVGLMLLLLLLGCLDKSQTNMFQVGNKNESKRIK